MPRGAAVIRYDGKRGTVWRIKYADTDGRQVQETVGAERDFRERVEAVRDEILRDVADLIERESGHLLDREHAEIVALGLIGMAETVAQRDPGASDQRRSEAVDTLVQLAWRGITQLRV